MIFCGSRITFTKMSSGERKCTHRTIKAASAATRANQRATQANATVIRSAAPEGDAGREAEMEDAQTTDSVLHCGRS